ncbi:hypothetical protein [Nonomuraea guangzhouensis]|uniref:Uncharacterized protein n=1 Tax=Nonomuraea guangzhouensis TaxID=1291555 RepID=A0ABW4GTA3_9ACTN|nr:hypothetical protein [Nonomuraea guangzhouensis]
MARTYAATLLAVAMPVMNDQPLWASRLMALDVASAAIPFRRLTPG